MTKKMTYEELVNECKKLRGKSERVEVEFFAFLLVAERKHEDVWTEAGCETFDQFLRSNHLAEVNRYRLFAIGVDRTSLDSALAYGIQWTIAAAQFVNEKALKEFLSRAAAFVETEHVAPSEQTVREWRMQIDSSSGKDHVTIRRATELNRLRAENEKLKAELAAAKKKIVELEEKLKNKGKAA